MSEERNCAFQYAKMTGGIFRDIKIIEDQTELTLTEAKLLWNKHYADAAMWIKIGNEVEMVLWINMDHPTAYGDSLQYISTDAESDGMNIWVTKREYFTKQLYVEDESINSR